MLKIGSDFLLSSAINILSSIRLSSTLWLVLISRINESILKPLDSGAIVSKLSIFCREQSIVRQYCVLLSTIDDVS